MVDPVTAAAGAEAAKAAREFLLQISKEPNQALGGMIADQINFWRFKRRVNLLLKAKEFLDQKGVIPGKVLPDKFIPLLEDGSNTEDPTLSDMFASLLAGEVDPETSDEIHPSYSKVLTQLSPLDARIISEIYTDTVTHGVRDFRSRRGFTLADAAAKFGVSEEIMLLTFQNLWRLGVCDHGSQPLDRLNQKKNVYFTDYGWAFTGACLKHRSTNQ